MKKIALALALLLIFSLLASCNEGDTPPEVTTTAATTTSIYPIALPDGVKTTTAFDDIELTVGMTDTELIRIAESDENVTSCFGYIFFTTERGENIVVVSKSNAVSYIHRSPWKSAERYSDVENGMTFFQMVDLIGLPTIYTYTRDLKGDRIEFIYNAPDGAVSFHMYLSDMGNSNTVYTKKTSSLDNVEIKVGMDISEINNIVQNDPSILTISAHIMFTNSNNENVIIQYDYNTNKILRIEKYARVSSDRYPELQTGMTLWQVVEMIGLPIGSAPTSGSSQLIFAIPDGYRALMYNIFPNQGMDAYVTVLYTK